MNNERFDDRHIFYQDWLNDHIAEKREKSLEYKRRYRKGKRYLTNNYIKILLSSISGIKFKDISPELIKGKREQIKLYRLIKKIKNELRSKTKEYVTSKCKHKIGLFQWDALS